MSLVHVDHSSLPPFLPEKARILILGSFPSVESRRQGFYYAHPSNRFFPVLAAALGFPEPRGIMERKALLEKEGIALYDVVYSCDIEKSKDETIENVVPIGLEAILEGRGIKRIFTTGKKAESLFRKAFSIDFTPLPSTSSANARMGKEKLVQVYRKEILPFLR